MLIVIATTIIAAVCGLMYLTDMPGHSPNAGGPLPPLTAREQALEALLRVHVHTLAGTIGARTVGRGLGRAADYIESELHRSGCRPTNSITPAWQEPSPACLPQWRT